MFSIPLEGQTIVTFYNRSTSVSSADIYNGSFQAWLEETYQWWAALSPCATAQAETTNTTQQTQQTAQNAAQAATNASAATNVPDTSTTNVPQTTSPPANQTATTNETTTTPQTTDTSKSTTQNDQTQTGSSETQSTSEDTSNTDTGGDNNDQQSDSSTESTNEESTSTEQESSTEESEQSTDETGNESDETESEDESVEEESAEEESTEEEEQEEESTEEEEEESTGEEEEKETEEEKEKKKKKKNLTPPIVTANIVSNQNLQGRYNQAINIGVSRSSLLGDKTYNLNTMVFQDLKQFMLTVGFSKVFLKDGRPKFVYSANVGASKIYMNFMATMSHSLVHLGKKGSVAGLSISGSSLWLNFQPKYKKDFTEQIVGMSTTMFYTKPIKLDRLTVSPMLAASYTPLSRSVFLNDHPPKSKDVMFIVGANVNYTLSKRFVLNLGSNVVKSTAKDFPYLVNFSIGSRFSF